MKAVAWAFICIALFYAADIHFLIHQKQLSNATQELIGRLLLASALGLVATSIFGN